ncbi:segregation/condensation protein A [Streptomyces sp. NA02950]|uniref:segregation/condensation protein A n=1 Tax=Streptomyces sp. NA02950 TaxID=2742137 RepID=UPI0020CAB798|nr:segregation/condensation protein A [Streptomyces sp. NA02950]
MPSASESAPGSGAGAVEAAAAPARAGSVGAAPAAVESRGGSSAGRPAVEPEADVRSTPPVERHADPSAGESVPAAGASPAEPRPVPGGSGDAVPGPPVGSPASGARDAAAATGSPPRTTTRGARAAGLAPRPEPDPAHARAEEGADGPVRPAGDGAGAPSGEPGGEAVSGPSAASADDAPHEGAEDDGTRFILRLDNFEGPFDLLLQLISKHKLDVTEVALSRVTDDFMAYIRAMGPDWDLDQTTEFLVVAATLLDLKAARLLPAAEVEDEADLALLEARDLLFARLLQYRAYKRIADIFNDRLISEAARHPRTVGLEPHHAELLPDVVISIGGEGFAKLAVKAMQPKPKPQVYVDHIHAPLVSVREQAEVVVARLRELGEASFRTLTEDAPDVLTVVARFLALLELYRERAVLLDQPEALGSLMVRWTGVDGEQPLVTDEFDQEAGARQEPPEGRSEGRSEQKEKQEVRS